MSDAEKERIINSMIARRVFMGLSVGSVVASVAFITRIPGWDSTAWWFIGWGVTSIVSIATFRLPK